jgi:hypothetical protein
MICFKLRTTTEACELLTAAYKNELLMVHVPLNGLNDSEMDRKTLKMIQYVGSNHLLKI